MATHSSTQREREHAPVLIQPQLEIGGENDEQEKEANHVADTIMKMPDSETDEKKKNTGNAGKVRMMTDLPGSIRKMSDGNGGALVAPPKVEQGISSSKGGGQPLPAATQQELGPKMGADLGNVNIHTDSAAVQMNKEIGAKAFTHGNDIYFNSGQYNPASSQGKHLLAHELTHTVQQGNGIGRKVQRQTDEIKTDKNEIIKKKYFEIVDKGEAHYLEAIDYLVKTYNLDVSHAAITYDSTITGAYAITGGNVGDKIVPVRIAPPCFDKSGDFGIICRAIAHELLHTKQKALDLIDSHDEREFLAYYDTITRTDMPEIKDMATLKMFIGKAVKYYNQLPADKQKMYTSKMDEINVIKTKHGF